MIDKDKYETGIYKTLTKEPDGGYSVMKTTSPLPTVANTPTLSDGILSQAYFDAQHEKAMSFLKFLAGRDLKCD